MAHSVGVWCPAAAPRLWSHGLRTTALVTDTSYLHVHRRLQVRNEHHLRPLGNQDIIRIIREYVPANTKTLMSASLPLDADRKKQLENMTLTALGTLMKEMQTSCNLRTTCSLCGSGQQAQQTTDRIVGHKWSESTQNVVLTQCLRMWPIPAGLFAACPGAAAAPRFSNEALMPLSPPELLQPVCRVFSDLLQAM